MDADMLFVTRDDDFDHDDYGDAQEGREEGTWLPCHHHIHGLLWEQASKKG